jgi:hypothetical protein
MSPTVDTGIAREAAPSIIKPQEIDVVYDGVARLAWWWPVEDEMDEIETELLALMVETPGLAPIVKVDPLSTGSVVIHWVSGDQTYTSLDWSTTGVISEDETIRSPGLDSLDDIVFYNMDLEDCYYFGPDPE